MTRLALTLTLPIVIAMFAAGAVADDAKPWTQPGSKAGQEIYGPDGGKMVWVPAGEFTMGATDGDPDEQPVHRVQISQGFWLSKFEVTISLWLEYCRDAQVLLRATILAPTNDHPMWGLNWEDVQGYCRFYGLSMPTEAQWEWAARGPEGRRYPWGDRWDNALCCNEANPGPEGYTCAVGAFPGDVSWCGARDMAGNLAEWCADWYVADYYAKSPGADPRGPETGEKRVQRGGYFWGDGDWCRLAKRFSTDPANDGGAGCARPCYVPRTAN